MKKKAVKQKIEIDSCGFWGIDENQNMVIIDQKAADRYHRRVVKEWNDQEKIVKELYA